MRLLVAFTVCLIPTIGYAEQPVFGMMPRWANGWGIQTQYEFEDTTDERSHVLHLEGVYTWARWIRVTYKVPLVLEGRAAGAESGERGLGTPVVTLPLKKYFNHDGLSGSWSVTPHLFVPVATTSLAHSDEFGGLSLSYAHETYYDAVDVGTAFHAVEGGEFEGHVGASYGRKIYGFGTFGIGRLRFDGKWRTTGGYELRAGGVAYWKFTDLIHAQATMMRSLAADEFATGTWVRGGVGMVF